VYTFIKFHDGHLPKKVMCQQNDAMYPQVGGCCCCCHCDITRAAQTQ